MKRVTRRDFIRDLGASAAILPFITNLPSLASTPAGARKKRLLLMFSPNGIVPKEFWPDAPGENVSFKRILQPLEPFRDKTLIVQGVSNKVRGDGDGHMRGMSCLLTAMVRGNSRVPDPPANTMPRRGAV